MIQKHIHKTLLQVWLTKYNTPSETEGHIVGINDKVMCIKMYKNTQVIKDQ